MIKTQSQRIVAISNYVLFAIVAMRAVLDYSSSAALLPLLILLAIFLLLLVIEPSVSTRWSAYRWIYFAVQTVLVAGMGFIVPEFNFLWGLYIILAGQAYHDLPRRTALIWMGGLIVIAGLFLMTTMDVALGLAILLNFIAVSIFLLKNASTTF